MGKVFVHTPRVIGRSKLPTEHAPDPEVTRELQAKRADDALLSQWAAEEKAKKAAERHETREIFRELTDIVRQAEAVTRWKVLLLEPELISAVDDVFEEVRPARNQRNVMRRVKRWTKGLAVTLPMMNKAIAWQRDFAWNKYPCMACGFDLGTGNLGQRVSYEVVIAMPGVKVGGLCRDCFELGYEAKVSKIIGRLNDDARRKDQRQDQGSPEAVQSVLRHAGDVGHEQEGG
jgi:hypothetical protein